MLWLALHFPSLPLDVFLRGHDRSSPEVPTVVVERQGRTEFVCTANAPARQAGVRPGMKRSAALALAGQLHCHARRPDKETEALDGVAAWALQFTPVVSLEPPAGLLLEIGGSLSYFHGLARLRRLVEAGSAALGFAQVRSGCAPTPLAASWRASVGAQEPVTQREALPTALAELPLWALPLSEAQREQLGRLGVQTLAQLRALPRAGLTQRFGAALPTLLDRALGLAPDPRASYLPPEYFERRIELNWSVSATEPLLFVGKRLLTELAGFLAGRGLSVQTVEFRLAHDERPASRLELGFGRPTRQAEDLFVVLRERLARFVLPAPVVAVSLVAAQLTPLAALALDLFDAPGVRGDRDRWLARMSARLGEAAVQGVRCHPEHRPECAWQPAAPGTASPRLNLGPRPGWLLPEPLALPLREDRPWYGEALVCLGRAERIESGWWDGEAVARDYYTALAASGRRYWIYQDRRSLAWYLHGVYA